MTYFGEDDTLRRDGHITPEWELTTECYGGPAAYP